MSDKKIRLGVSGLGGRGQSWVNDCMKDPNVEVVAATDINPDAVATAKKKWPDLVYITTLRSSWSTTRMRCRYPRPRSCMLPRL